ncbi:MAG: hypothetical protein ABWW70_07650 [Thermoproteota archaeon]
MTRRKESLRRVKEEKRRLRKRIRSSFSLLALLTLTILLLYYANPEVAVGSLPGVNKIKPRHRVSFESILLKAVLYKIVMENLTGAEGARVGVALVIANTTLDYGVYNWTSEANMVFVNESRTVTLDADESYTVYFVNTLTGVTIPVALVDSKYRSSFDSLVDYPPFQLHFVFYPDKCGPRISMESDKEVDLVVELYREESGEAIYSSFVCSPPRCEHVVTGCYTDVRVGVETSLWGLLRVRIVEGAYYLLPGRSAVILLTLLPPALLLARDAARYKRLKGGVN